MMRYNTLKAKKEKYFTSIKIIPTKNLLTPRKASKTRQGRQMSLTSLFGMIAPKQESPCIFRYRGFSL
jgi:hypothetical protein